MKINKSIIRTIIFFISLIVLGWIISFFVDLGSSDKSAEEVHKTKLETTELQKIVLQLKWTLGAGFAGELVAQEKGFFLDRGLEVDLREGGVGIDPIKTVATGDTQFGIVGGDRLILAREKRVPIVGIALQSPRSFVVFVSLESSDITNPLDFENHTVGIQHDDTYTVYQALIRKAQVNREKVKEISAGWDIALLLNHVVDVYPSYIVNQPVQLKQRKIKFNVIKPWDYGVQVVGNIYITSEDMIKNESQTVEAFVSALVEGWKYAMKFPEEAVDIVLQHQPELNREEELGILNAIIQHLKEDNRALFCFNVTDFQATQAMLVQQEVLHEPIELHAGIDPRFVTNCHAK